MPHTAFFPHTSPQCVDWIPLFRIVGAGAFKAVQLQNPHRPPARRRPRGNHELPHAGYSYGNSEVDFGDPAPG